MESYIEVLVSNFSLPLLAIIIVISFYALGKGADILVNNAVDISKSIGIPKMIIGATIVSLGTTLPEVSVSVVSAMHGNPDLALGNAVGSIICDTALIIGIATTISPLKINKEITNRHGWIQFGAGVLLVIFSIPYSNLSNMLISGGTISRYVGFLFLLLLLLYIFLSIKWTKTYKDECALDDATCTESYEIKKSLKEILGLILGIAIVILSSNIVIPAIKECAIRFNIPNSVIAATIVAFGTSLPELITAVTASRKGHGDLALGNIIGADILNVLFVVGASASFSKQGIKVSPEFFKLYFPSMLAVLLVFRIGTILSKERLNKWFGIVLLGLYIMVNFLSYF
ncbi:K+-dependent Na+/Ca+ exchanger like-protein [Gottschalkia purinilytica]|uniref:K+-dependent Na+/Ca+ exchanger like-protein n=1 Tax=Gottschalkia purinilytica TaxID=1503 RepID=A0A0L0WDQ8_GOTPU|nr:calcium/sodium antiporter [Gottschalkia purinilytica]KNF09612.1 K+-dependent Na+/Ca+ exchanger like-protein [Gottschalkia purinilytica]